MMRKMNALITAVVMMCILTAGSLLPAADSLIAPSGIETGENTITAIETNQTTQTEIIDSAIAEQTTQNEADILFGSRSEEIGIEEALSGTNPHYESCTAYSDNCQRCVQTYELRRRGYNVEALSSADSEASIVWGNECFKDASGSTPSFRYHLTESQIRETMQNAPEGARFVIYIVWNTKKSSHVFAAEKIDDQVQYIDPQDNDSHAENYFTKGYDGEYGILRIDDKELTDNVSILAAVAASR